MEDCRLLRAEDVEPAARVLAEALMEDPLCVYMLPSARARRRALYVFFHVMVRIQVDNERVFGTGDPLVGVAIWKKPDQGELSVSVRAIGRLLPLLFTRYPLGLARAQGIVGQTEAMHKQHAPGLHYYLDNLGVVPTARGHGAAGRVVRPFLESADRERVLVYTDTVNAANVAFYEYFGFRLAEERIVSGTGITVYGLRREPCPLQSAVGSEGEPSTGGGSHGRA